MPEEYSHRPEYHKVALVIAGAALAALLVYEVAHHDTTPPLRPASPTVIEQKTSQNPPAEAPAGSALQILGTLSVKGRAPKTGYAREQFGSGWAEIEGCDMRNFILQRDLQNKVLKSDNCTVLTGTLHDPYTDKIINFVRGVGTSDAVQIDHVVALSDAWQTGAQQLDEGTRAEFANDPLELLAVDGPTNEAKSDSDAASWLPPNKSFRCTYVARQIAVKQKYALWVTSAEKGAMQTVLATCPAEPLPKE